MQNNQVFSWAEIGARIRAKRVFLYWFIPITFIVIWVLTFSVPTYYSCSTSLSTEQMRSTEVERAMTINHPENFDLGLAPLAYSIVPDDYVEVINSTDFLCKLLLTPVLTKDSSFAGTYYEYLATQYRYPWHKSIKRFLQGKKQPLPGEPLPELDAFYPKGLVAEVIALTRKNIGCEVDHTTKLTTISVVAQDPLVAALVAQATSDNLQQVTSQYYLSKSEEVYEHIQDQLVFLHAEYNEAMEHNDQAYAEMVSQAYTSFRRQAIVFNAQLRYYRVFTTLNNVSVPTEKAGPRHLTLAVIGTFLLTLLAILCICHRELFTMFDQAAQ